MIKGFSFEQLVDFDNSYPTGYKLRRHIGHALKSRSQAIRTALDNYNAAAAKIPSKRSRRLKWEQVVEYAFLADFDLLRDTRQDISEKIWTKPKARRAMDQYFGMLRAQEEIERLNIEIRRLVTYIVDEEALLLEKEAEHQAEDPCIAHQIKLHRLERGRFNQQHMKRLRTLSKLSGFTGNLSPGVSIHATGDSARSTAMDVDENPEGDGEEEEDDVDQDEVEQAAQVLEMMLAVTGEEGSG